MEFLPEGFINLYISESGICICHIYVRIYLLSVSMGVITSPSSSAVCVCVRFVSQKLTHHINMIIIIIMIMIINTVNTPTSNGRAKVRPGPEPKPEPRAGPTERICLCELLFFFFFCFFVFYSFFHLKRNVTSGWKGVAHLGLPTICSMSSLRSAAYSIVRRLQLQLVTQLLNGQEPQRVEWTRHIGLALIRFALPAAGGGGGGGRRRGVGDVPAAMAAQTSGFVSFSRKYNTHTDKSLCQRDSNNPNKAKRLNSWSCFIWFQPQIHFSRRRFAVGCCCEQRALSAALAVNQIRWWFSACLWLQSHFPFLVPHSPFPIFHFSPNCTDATQQLQPRLRQRQRLRLWLRLRLRLTLRHSQASKVAQSFRPLHSVARALKNCQHSICVQSNVATNYEIYHKRIELHCSIITTFWYLLKHFEIFETNQRNNC